MDLDTNNSEALEDLMPWTNTLPNDLKIKIKK